MGVAHYGCVIDKNTDGPIADAVVQLVPDGSQGPAPDPKVTTNAGMFEFKNVDDQQKWQLIVFYPTQGRSKEIDVPLDDGKDAKKPVVYPVVPVSTLVDQKLGTWLLAILLILLCACVYVWLSFASARLPDALELLDATARAEAFLLDQTVSHRESRMRILLDDIEAAIPENAARPNATVALATARSELQVLRLLHGPTDQRMGDTLTALAALDATTLPENWGADVAKAQEAYASWQNSASEAAAAPQGSETDTQEQATAASRAAFDAAIAALSGAQGQAPAAAEGLIAVAQMEDDDAARAFFLTRLRALQQAVLVLAREEATTRWAGFDEFNWIVGPNIVVTVLFWGFVGSTVRLVMVVQGYLRFGRFYRIGIYQHLALLLAVPWLSAGFVKLASLVTIEAGSADLQLDFNNPQIMAVAAFLLALSPWGLWERLLGLSGGISGAAKQNDS